MDQSKLVQNLGGRSIVLVGIMGSGKSSVGRRLATYLGLDFTDADSEIESAAGMPIAEIFAQHGEGYFRDGERRVIDRLLREKQRVLATGGGAFMSPQTRAAIAAHGISIWLKADHDVLMRRVKKRSNRPLLQTDDPDSVMRRLMEERYPIYATADFTIISNDGPHESVVASIIELLRNFRDRSGRQWRNTKSTVNVDIDSRRYNIVIGRNNIEDAGALIRDVLPNGACAVVTDQTVAANYLSKFLESLDKYSIRHEEFILSPGEQTKSLAEFASLSERIIANRFERNDIIVALGGGVIGDLAGFTAACIRRGMRFIQVPTTLLAQVDSSVGGKTAINSAYGKNLIGAFYQPSLVIADTACLETLPDRQFRAGYAEVVKYGLINDAAFFYWLEEHHKDIFQGGPELAEAIRISCAAKAAVVARDETEQAERALLNLGHTFGHAFEVLSEYNPDLLVHGEAVAAGLACAARFSARLGFMSRQDAERIGSHLDEVGLPTRIQHIQPLQAWSPDQLLQAMFQDKKVSHGKLTFILMREIGKSFIARGIEEKQVLDFLYDELQPN